MIYFTTLSHEIIFKVIQWPDENRQVEIEREFQLQSGIPHIVGIIDGTHIQLSHVPNGDQDYVNRKSYPSVQLQVRICCNSYPYYAEFCKWTIY